MTEQMTHSQTLSDERQQPQQAGQTIVLMVFMIIGLLAFVGLAADVGFLFARSSQFSSAVDSAALAGVIEMDPTAGNLEDADDRAKEFLEANGWTVVSPTVTFVSTSTLTIQGIPQYTITVTWPVETFFMGLLGFSEIPVTRSATAVFFAQAEVYTPSAVESGHIRQASQFILGPDSCTTYGDPVSPERSTASPHVPNADPAHLDGIYRYRIRITDSYTRTNIVRVELFDPDSVNLDNRLSGVDYTNSWDGGGGSGTGDCSGHAGQPCVIETGENINARTQNPYWFVRVDENYDDECNPVSNGDGSHTVTQFELYYYDDGERVPWATYTDDNSRTNLTDMKWVTPGVTPGLSVDSGSAQSSFDVDINAIPEVNDMRYIYLDVKTTGGSARNVWDIRAGLPNSMFNPPLATDVNERNLQMANYPGNFKNNGVAVYAVGRMPLKHWVGNHQTTLPIAPIDSSHGGGTVYATIFDYDIPQPKVLTFTIDSVSPNIFRVPVQVVGNPDHVNPLAGTVTCTDGTTCNNFWWQPQLRLGIPTGSFFGGDLQATYVPRRNAHTWSVSITDGAPILTR
ncbi:MAG TPA: Tad domain-containing protein [Candidatus Sulfomarinibacteraceae bacterium]|nr:Tad domain-containing protein [Candidatus Sulfomarinibacteraceae bacterium]